MAFIMPVHPALVPPPPAYVQVQAVAPNAGAAGTSDAAASSAGTSGQRSTRQPVQSANHGNLASNAVPGGVNHAPNKGKPPSSFSAPATSK